jgi:hypothetical protein
MPELEDRRYPPPTRRTTVQRADQDARAAAFLVVVAVRVGYPLWFVGALTALGTFALAVERWVLIRRAF